MTGQQLIDAAQRLYKPDDDDLFIGLKIRLTESEFILLNKLSLKTGKTTSEIMRTALKYYGAEVL